MKIEQVTKTYKGQPRKAQRLFEGDKRRLAKKGWTPVSERYEQGTWGCLAFTVALLLFIVIIGIIVFLYLLIVKPDGTLFVTYERVVDEAETKENWSLFKKKPVERIEPIVKRDESSPRAMIIEHEEKTCPDCAETVKLRANVCRFCGYRFAE